MQKILVVGHLGADAEVKIVENSTWRAIVFSVASTKKWKDASGNQQSKTTWYRCTYWKQEGKTRIAEFLKKGTLVAIDSEDLEARGYVNRENQASASLELTVSKIELLGSTGSGSQAPNPNQVPGNNTPPVAGGNSEDDLPF